MPDAAPEYEVQKPESVSHLTARIKHALEPGFSSVWIEGEISNAKITSETGHAYFTLKDDKAQISCVFFSFARHAHGVELKDGAKARVRGFLSVYEPRGSYQLIVRSLQYAGEGDLMRRFDELKRRLDSEGLFDPKRKRPIPKFPAKIGIVTSPTGAAIRDMLNVTRRRFAKVHIVIAPSRVQGTGSAAEIVAGIEMLNSLEKPPDVIIVGRGGGSMEDLWCFNEEPVARAIRASRVPVISAVGHEIDFTISDFASDLRAPTPSAAAELVIGQVEEITDAVENARKRISTAVSNKLGLARAKLAALASHRVFGEPEYLLGKYQQNLDMLLHKMSAAINTSLTQSRFRLETVKPRLAGSFSAAAVSVSELLTESQNSMFRAAETKLLNMRGKLETLKARLAALNPESVLSRGYAMLSDAGGHILKSVSQVVPGMKITAELCDGSFDAYASSHGGAPKQKPRIRDSGRSQSRGDTGSQQSLFNI